MSEQRESRDREIAHYDATAAALDPAAMVPQPPNLWERSILAALGDVEGRDVLELGSGYGDLTLHLVDRGANVVAVEMSPGTVDLARRRLEVHRPGATVRFVAAPAETTGLADGSVDVAVGKWVLHHTDVPAALDELHRVLRPGGTAIFNETSALNPVLDLARRRVAGRLGVARLGTEDEQPIGRAQIAEIRARFTDVVVDHPDFQLLSIVDRNVLKRRLGPRWTDRFHRWDLAIGRRAPRLRPLSYYVRLRFRRA